MLKSLRSSITFLVIYLFFVFGLVYLTVKHQSVIVFPSFLHFLVVGTVIALIVFPQFQKVSLYRVFTIFSVLYGIFYLITSWGKITSEAYQFHNAVVTFVLYQGAVWAAYDVGKQLQSLNQSIDQFVQNAFPSRVLDYRMAEEKIGLELTRSRRHNRPLTVMTIQPKLPKFEKVHVLQGVQQDIVERFAVARVGQLVTILARQTDVVLRDHSKQFILLLPETDVENSTVLAERISTEVREQLEMEVVWGVATFPDDALIFEDLLYQSSQSMQKKR